MHFLSGLSKLLNMDKMQTPQINLENPTEFRQFIEREVLKVIKTLAEGGKTSKERIQEIAKHTLNLIMPGLTLEQLYQNSCKLDDAFAELAPVVYQVMYYYEQKYEKKVLEQVSALIKDGQYESAQNMVKKVLMYKGMGVKI